MRRNDSYKRSSGERADCSVNAMAYAFDMTYDEAHELCEKHGRKRGHGFDPNTILRIGKFKQHRTFMGRRVSFHKRPGCTVGNFQKRHPKGNYLVRITEHVFTMIDGVIKNQGDMGQYVQYYYKISEPFKKNEPQPIPEETPVISIDKLYQYNDGGRAASGFKGEVGDCVVRSIAIATGKPYKEVYAEIYHASRDFAKERKRHKIAKSLRSGGYSPRYGVYNEILKKYLLSLGWEWVPTMFMGKGCQVHLRPTELPRGTIIARLSRHLTTVIDGVIHDNHDPSREGNRCVYGYFHKITTPEFP